MPAKPVQVSLDIALLERIDQDPETKDRGRSAFVQSAVTRYLDFKDRKAVDARIAAAYAGRAERALADIADLVDAQSWPDE